MACPNTSGPRPDAPITVELAPPIGVAQPFAVTGSTTLGSPDATPMTGEVTGSYTRTETGVTVDTPLGVVTGCDHFTATATVPFLFGATIEVSGDLWYSPQLGLVQATMAAPLAGLGMGLAGSYDKADLGDGWAAVTRVELHGGVNTDSAAFELSSLDYAGEFDADKNTHAKMYLEIRWADEAMAATDQMPFVSPEFGTVWGVFPFTLVMSPVSLLFPEDNARGLNHWIAYVDQAAKNEAENGIAYGVTVPYDPSFSGIRIAGRVIYKRLPAP